MYAAFRKSDGTRVKPGDILIDHVNNKHRVTSIGEPYNELGHGGRIYTDQGGFFAGVFNCEWKEATL